MPGFVSLVGAGPGDPELLTIKARRRLKEADLVLYDALVDASIVAIAHQAQRFCVGKRSHRRAVDQATIDRLMIRGARRGKRVVRLKSGDPFVLGRGGEEALTLTRAGVPFEIVPGLTSAVAAPGLAGVPVTHRGLASGFVVVSGHTESAFGPVLDGIVPHTLTVVVLMGLATRHHVAERLRQCGWRADTPAAIILSASTTKMRSWVGRLDQLAAAEVETDDHAPGTIVIGDVVGVQASVRAAPMGATSTEPVAVRQQG